jgi:putative endonuclease
MNKEYYVYILANKKNGTLFTGVTSDLIRRVYEHKNHVYKDSFSEKYSVSNLVWYEITQSIESAIFREKQIKGKNRNYKINLIESSNLDWKDLWQGLIG